MYTTSQLLCHMVGDYVLQTDHMALRKRQSWLVALAHGLAYSLPFLLLGPSWAAWLVIALSHALIDRLGLARYVCWAKNWLAPRWIKNCHSACSAPLQGLKGGWCHGCGQRGLRNYPWDECRSTGYHRSRPEYLSVWLVIIVDNLMHILINGLALRWL